MVGEMRPGPRDHHDQAVAESDQEKNMDEEPGQPGEISGQLELAELGDSGGAADCGQAAFVVITKIAARLIFKVAGAGVRTPVPFPGPPRLPPPHTLALF